ncbi:MAG: hypothetical protein WB471_04035, partial [Nocardioides sp.]
RAEDGPGASTLVRGEGADLFGFGAREAVLRAVRGDPADRAPFGAPVTADELAALFGEAISGAAVAVISASEVCCSGSGPLTGLGAGLEAERRAGALLVLAFAHGWRLAARGSDGCERASDDTDLRFRPAGP